MADPIAGGPWTRHGHPIPGVTVAGPGRPTVKRCGGPALCWQCRYDVDTRTLVADVLARAAGEQAVNTATVPDEETRAHPLHPIIADALRSGMAPGHPDVVRVWGRTSPPGLNRFGVDDNAWAGTPEDVADHLVRAIVNRLPVVAGRYVIAPLLPSVATELERLARLPIVAHGQVEVPASEPVAKPDTAGQVMRCEVCGCTDDQACPGGCWWARPGLCSRCTGLVPG